MPTIKSSDSYSWKKWVKKWGKAQMENGEQVID